MQTNHSTRNPSSIVPFVWGEISFPEIVFIDGIPYATRRSIGEWLGYADPQNAIDKILERNSYIRSHSVPVRLSGTDGKNYETFVYHPIGFLLIVMESGQPKAKVKKEEIAEYVFRFAGPQQLTHKEQLAYLKHRRTLLCDLARTGDAAMREAFLQDLREVSMLLGMPVPLALTAQLPLPGV